MIPPPYHSISPLIFSQRLSLYTSWRRGIQSSFFQHQIPSVSSAELTLPRSAGCALSRLRCNGHSTFLASYLHRIGRAETSLCSNCGSESQDIFHLMLDFPVLDSLCPAIFGHSLTILGLWSRPWGFARLLGPRRVDPRPPSLGTGKVSPPPPTQCKFSIYVPTAVFPSFDQRLFDQCIVQAAQLRTRRCRPKMDCHVLV